ncbi:centrosomal protein of 170 kDa protein B isoform X2 [Brienomyrus brachyistius]|uniref:centrosomal protein of 170 kDa protein B isoform X2 n=1 Tax=Brienomyrus brachyistius TaxID=42636 RepID=UPI0020B453B5|nr:centrosomal protein of 170 kDa protein B isoform X2 [Brienomyrus brachyistius]
MQLCSVRHVYEQRWDASRPLSVATKMSVTSWFLVSSSGTRHRLPREMIFVGREDCELMLQSRSVDKQHAVINYDPSTDEHLVKDLGSLNGTFVNDVRIPDQTYITLKLSDVVRFGYDSHIYVLERSQHKVPEEALKHEKYTSQLQMSLKVQEGRRREKTHEKGGLADPTRSKTEKVERKAVSEAPDPRPTPLYGQPSWWGDNDVGQKRESCRPNGSHADHSKVSSRPELEVNGSNLDYRDPLTKPVYPYRREPSYFEIPTKEFLHSKPSEGEVQEIPTKDTDSPAKPAPTSPVVQSHASFTIEFDDCKMKIKDHITKFSFRQRKPPFRELATPTEVMSAESKVADWLVTSDVSMMRSKVPCEDVYSTKSDLPMQVKTLKGHHHEDGTQSDSEGPVLKDKRAELQQSLPSRPLSLRQHVPPPVQKPPSPPPIDSLPAVSSPEPRSPPSPQGQGRPDPQQAFIIEFFDDIPRKKRSQSFTQNSAQPDMYSAIKAKLEKRKAGVQTGERPAPSQGHAPPTQQITVPLKVSGAGALPRSASLKREKMDERTSSPPSGSSFTIRPFGSVGRRSKLAQDFAAEFLRESSQMVAPAQEKTSPPPILSPRRQAAYCSPATNPIHSPRSRAAQLGVCPDIARTTQAIRNEEEDSLSDAGTYTIETDAQDKEVEEARNMIDQVFGVLDSPEYTGVTMPAYRPVINQDREQQASKCSSGDLKAAPEQTCSPEAFSGSPSSPAQLQAQPTDSVSLGGPKWVSRWASLADSYTESGPAGGLLETPPQGNFTDGDGTVTHHALPNHRLDSTEPEASHGSRTRRLLPQVPPSEKAESSAPSTSMRRESSTNREAPEQGVATGRQGDAVQRLTVQDELEPDSLSDASKSDDGSAAADRSRNSLSGGTERPTKEKTRPQPKSTFFYIGSEDVEGAPSLAGKDRNPPQKASSATTLTQHKASLEPKRAVKPTASALASNFFMEDTGDTTAKENGSSLLRQESFTRDKPSDAVHVHQLPHIHSDSPPRDTDRADTHQGQCGQDTQSFLRDTENALAALEAKLQAQTQGCSQRAEDSLSGESDIDTSSTVSLVSNQNASIDVSKKKAAVSSTQKGKSSSLSVQDQGQTATALERLSEKRRSQTTNGTGKADADKQFHRRRSSGTRGSLELSDETQNSSQPPGYWHDNFSSDQETGSRTSVGKKPSIRPQREDLSKASKGHQGLTRSNSLSAPRATRASMLRRARLGDASDNEGTETDRTSQNSDPAKPAADAKKLSRLDILALPRKRTGSFTTPSDTESSAGRTGFSTRSSEPGSSVRKASTAEPRSRHSLASTGKQPVSRTRSSSAKHSATAGPRRRQKGSDYTSTSDEEYDGTHGTPKHKRSQSSAASQTPQGQAPNVPRLRSQSRQSEDEENEGDPFQNWSAHSAEIARLSQDLAKDLAILAREIHDVAGDGDSQAPSPVPSTPASTISAREELVQRIPEASLNYQKVPPGSARLNEPDQNTNDQDPNSKRRVWNREEVMFDHLMLNPVSQLSQAIRENTEQLAEKMKTMFHDRLDAWEELEARINADNEVPILKTSNKEITSILKELRRVQKQLEVINTIIGPCPIPGHGTPKSRLPSKESRPASQTDSTRERIRRAMADPEVESIML